ncbi:peptidoglycan editing factor PgeF [uncultured Veillonella sp.]|uniref:peptidoglycan editing factor PgeF n=1 Tax=uncultured Veillonella sp. TaxID=159268 RepID=UPI002627448A|nr:peptidoglycan editing factor PgeF [uncultured Veillonella sp.]
MDPLNRTIIREGGGFPGQPFEFESAANLTGFPLMHGVTRRFGGVSKKPFDSFNLGLHVEDQVQDVVENRRRLAKHLRVRLEDLTCAKQVHGVGVAQVTQFNRGHGATSLSQAIPDSDAMMTDLPQTPLLLLVADCVPVLIYDAKHHAIAVVHAGWRGAIGHLPTITLEAMAEAYGTNPADCYAYLGPSIQSDSFEVSETLADQFRKESAYANDIVYYRYRSDKQIETPRVDLQQFIVHDLLRKGVPLRQITVSGTDTLTSPSCYSYRREHGKTGRMALFAMLRAKK